MVESLWVEVWKAAGVTGVALLGAGGFIWYQNRIFLPKLLDDNRKSSTEQQGAFNGALGEQRADFTKALGEQRSDFLQAQRDAGAAHAEQCNQQSLVFERRCDALIAANREMSQLQSQVYLAGMQGVSEELRILKQAVVQATEIGVWAAGEAAIPSPDESKRRGAREVLAARERERERGA